MRLDETLTGSKSYQGDFTHRIGLDHRVLEPMAGTGSTIIAAIKIGRHGYGLELSSHYVEIARNRVAHERQLSLFDALTPQPEALIVQGDATSLSEIAELKEPKFNYAVTSPPYRSMLTNSGSENQRAMRKKGLPLVYSNDDRDLGNVRDYDKLLTVLKSVYDQVADQLVDDGYLPLSAVCSQYLLGERHRASLLLAL